MDPFVALVVMLIGLAGGRIALMIKDDWDRPKWTDLGTLLLFVSVAVLAYFLGI